MNEITHNPWVPYVLRLKNSPASHVSRRRTSTSSRTQSGQSNQRLAVSLREQRDKAQQEHDDLLMEYRTQSQRLKDLEQELEIASPYRPHSPARLIRHQSLSLASTRASIPYERPSSSLSPATQPTFLHEGSNCIGA